jgi:hypothetical protein
MVFRAHVLDILIASPGDVRSARDAVERECQDWTASRAEQECTTLRPRRFETDSVSLVNGLDPQSIINAQLVDTADIVIALFHSRLGTGTPRAISATVEELFRAASAGKPTHVFFSTQKHPNDVDVAQVSALREFRRALENLGLIAEYSSLQDLRSKVRRLLDFDIFELKGRLLHPRHG